MNNDEKLKQLIPDFLSGRLSKEENAMFEKGMTENTELKQEVDALRPFFSNLESTTYYSNFEEESRTLTAGILSKLDSRKRKKRVKSYMSWAGLAVSAMILIVVGINFLPFENNINNPNGIDYVDVVDNDSSIIDTSHNLADLDDEVNNADYESVSDEVISIATEAIIDDHEEIIEELMDLDNIIYEDEIETSNINELIEVIEDVTIL